MPDLEIDMHTLDRIMVRLGSLSIAFESTEQLVGGLEQAVGHRQLAGTVQDFARAWTVHRRDIIGRIDFVVDAVTAIHDTFAELDLRLATQAEKLDDGLFPSSPSTKNGR